MKIEEAVAHARSYFATPECTPEQDGPLEALARAYLALHHEDDGELVARGIHIVDGHEVEVMRHGPLWQVHAPANSDVFVQLVTKSPPTMGQLRHLIRGLGGEA